MSGSTHARRGDLVVLVGNPATRSRTSTMAHAVAEALRGDEVPTTVELADLAELSVSAFHGPDERLEAARSSVGGARLLVVATPAYKAAPTGLLKVFLDGFGADALARTVVVPVVVAGSPEHGSSTDVHLRTVLKALGARLPAPSFVLQERDLADLPQIVRGWRERFGADVQFALDGQGRTESVVA